MFFNQQKVPSGQVPKNIIRRNRQGFFKGLLALALVLLLGYQTYAVHELQKGQVKTDSTQSEEIQTDAVGMEVENELELQLFGLLGNVGKSQLQAQKLEVIKTKLNRLEAELNLPKGFVWEKLSVIEEATNNRVLAFTIDENTAEFVVNQPDQQLRFADVADISLYLNGLNVAKWSQLKQLAARKAKLAETLLGELASAQTQQLLQDKELTWNQQDGYIEFVNTEQTPLLTIAADPVSNNYYLDSNKAKAISGSELTAKLSQSIFGLDTRSELQKLLDQQKTDFEMILNSEAFKAALKENQLDLVSHEDKAEGIYYYFQSSLTDSGFTVILEHGTGLVKVVKDGLITSLDEFLTQDKKKTIDIPANFAAQSSGGTQADKVMLLAGKHGSLTDTMMLAFINDNVKTVHLISIPRDLWWQGKKINSYFAAGGMPYLVEQLEKIAKVKIENYTLIDMYAFIDVINILGGVDITLEESVIDPSYKVLDNGVWGTLHYEPGTYHLNGVEALRLARTRHYSSDFARAERQQQILKALQKKAQALSLKDLPKIIALAKAVLSQVETDVTLTQTLEYYEKYKEYAVVNSGVLSSGNILYSKSSNQEAYDVCISAGGTDCDKGAYILLPRNDDWSVIPWYVNQLLKGS